MLLDSKLIFGTNVSHASKTASTVTEFTNVLQLDAVKGYLTNDASGNPINLNSKLNDIGRGGGTILNIMVGNVQLAASSATANMDIRLHKKASASSIKSGTVIFTANIPSIKKAASIASHTKVGRLLIKMLLPKGIWGDTSKKYIGISTKVLSQTVLTGALTAWLGNPGADQGV